MQAIELIKSSDRREPAPEETRQITQYCYEHGLITITAGSYGNVIRVLVPLVASDAIMDEGLDILESALQTVYEKRGHRSADGLVVFRLIREKIMTTATATLNKVPNYINGQWVESSAREWMDVINPATGEVICQSPLSDTTEVNSAIEAAAAAFPEWRRTPAEDRIQPLFKLKMLLEEHVDELGRIITQENGKTFAEGKAELRRAIENVEVACGIPMMMQGYSLEDVPEGSTSP